jgi:hypothetical protein
VLEILFAAYRPRTPVYILKFSACLHETAVYTEITYTFQCIPSARHLLFSTVLLWACVVPKSRAQPRLARQVCNVFVFTFTALQIHPGLKTNWFSPAKGMTSDWSEQFFVNINNTIYDRNVTGASDKSMLELHNLLRIFNFNHLQKILSFTLLECY